MTDPAGRAASGRIPLRVQGAEGVRYRDVPVTQGIPFADGVLAEGTPVRVVDPAGRAVPTQSRTLTHWNCDRRFVKWLLVDFPADLPEGGEAEWFLEYGPDAQPPEPAEAICLETPDVRVARIDTGRLRMEISARWPREVALGDTNVFAWAQLREGQTWRDLWRDRAGPHLYMSDQHGEIFDTHRGGTEPRIEIEESGPLRCCLRIEGHHGSPEGHRFVPYILRLHFFAGRADVRILHTFVFDQEPHFVELSSIVVHLPAIGGEMASAILPGGSEPVTLCGAGRLEGLQSADDRWEVFEGECPRHHGERDLGWAVRNGASGGSLAVFKDLWQEYPGGLAADADGLDVQVWPKRYGRNLAFTSPFEEKAIFFGGTRDEEHLRRLIDERPNAPLHLKSFNPADREDFHWVERMAEKYGRGRTITHLDTQVFTGYGAAKTTEIHWRIAGEAIDAAEAAGYAACVQEPLVAPALAAHTCATGAAGELYHAGEPRFAAVDEGLDFLLEDVAVEPRERGRLYGKMRYGNMVCSHSPGSSHAWIEHRDDDPAKALRWLEASYNNEANDQILSVWGNALRTARREHILFARSYSRAVADVAFIHTCFNLPWMQGLNHYHNAHWWSGFGSPSHTLLGGILTDYFFTGDRRLLEVARENADRHVRLQEPCGVLSNRDGQLHREFTGPLMCLLQFYQATWEQRYGDVARRSLRWFLRAAGEGPKYPASVYTAGERGDEAVVEPPTNPSGEARETYELFEIALRLFPDETLRRRILAEADWFVWDAPADNYLTAEQAREHCPARSRFWEVDGGFYWTNWAPLLPHFETGMVVLAYRLTRDPVYAAYARYRVDQVFRRQVDRCRHGGDWRFSWLWFGNYIPRLVRIVADAEARDPTALDAAEGQWKARRAAAGRAVYEGPGIDCDADDMDAGGAIHGRPPAALAGEAPGRRHEPRVNLGPLKVD